jgi:hypothetical protein
MGWPWDWLRMQVKVKYKSVLQKKRPVPIGDPEAPIPQYKEIKVTELSLLPYDPPSRSEFPYSEKFTSVRVDAIINAVPNGFLQLKELELLLYIVGIHLPTPVKREEYLVKNIFLTT